MDSKIFSFNNYEFFRHDRLDGYGGVCLYVLNSYSITNLNLPNIRFSDNLDLLLNDYNIILTVAYRKPSGNLIDFFQDLDAHMSYMSLNYNNQDFTRVIMGDFNIDMRLSLDNNESDYINNNAKKLVNIFSTYGFQKIINTSLTHRSGLQLNSLIDNFFVSNIHSIELSGTLSTDITDHLPLFSCLLFNADKFNKVKNTKNNIDKNSIDTQIVDYEAVKIFLNRFNWESYNFDLDVDTSYNLINSIITTAIQENTYKKSRKIRFKIPNAPWVHKNILKVIEQKEGVFHQLKKKINVDNIALKTKYKELKYKIKCMINESKKIILGKN